MLNLESEKKRLAELEILYVAQIGVFGDQQTLGQIIELKRIVALLEDVTPPRTPDINDPIEPEQENA